MQRLILSVLFGALFVVPTGEANAFFGNFGGGCGGGNRCNNQGGFASMCSSFKSGFGGLCGKKQNCCQPACCQPACCQPTCCETSCCHSAPSCCESAAACCGDAGHAEEAAPMPPEDHGPMPTPAPAPEPNP